MKRAIALAIVLLFALAFLPGCDVLDTMEITSIPLSTPTPVPTPLPTQTPIPTPSPSLSASPIPANGEVIVFQDPIMEKRMRQVLSIHDRPVTKEDMLKVWKFDFDGFYAKQFGGRIKTIDDLRWCLNVKIISLSFTDITDISALSGTRDLLEFRCDEKLDDLTPLYGNQNLNAISLFNISDSAFRGLVEHCSQLDSVRLLQSDISSETLRVLAESQKPSYLWLMNCGISDISPVAGMKGLEFLFLDRNQIKDLSPLAGNAQLCQNISLNDNQITDWSPLEGMTELKYLSVRGNPVTQSPSLDKLAQNGCKIEGNEIR